MSAKLLAEFSVASEVNGGKSMSGHREEWRETLREELIKLDQLTFEQLVSRFSPDEHFGYDVVKGESVHQVDIQLMELDSGSAHFIVSVDDGRLPESRHPASCGFVKSKDGKSLTYEMR